MVDEDRSDDPTRLEPQEAAALLDKAERDARRQFSLRPPWVTALMGLVILVGYGALWLSTRSQRPYEGPSLGVIGLVYAVVAIAIALSVRIYRHATAGITGPSKRQQGREGIAVLISYLGSPVIQGALKNAVASNAIIYGIIPAAAPLIIVGTTVVGIAASKADWPQFAAALVAVVGGVVAAFVGPSGAWLAAGIGLFVAVAGYAAMTGTRLARFAPPAA